MAYDFLNTTTYTNQLAQQQQMLQQLQDAAASMQTPLGSGFDLNNYDNDLIEIVAGEVPETDNSSSDLMEQPTTQQDDFLDESTPDDRVDMELINSMFTQDEPTPKPRTRTVYVQQDNNNNDNEDTGKTSYDSNGKVKPRIWQYGGKVPKYQTGGTVHDPSLQAISDILIWRNRNKNFVDRAVHPNGKPQVQTNTLPGLNNQGIPDYEFSTHRMAYDTDRNTGKGRIYPTLVQKPGDNQLTFLDSDQAWNYANDNNEYIETPNYKIADYLSEYGYKYAADNLFGTNYAQYMKKQYGGNTLYADTYEQQRIGLNDPNYNTAVFSTKGTNTFRGLDNYQPVAITDGKKYKVLHGPKDTAKFTGKVYEQKMQYGGRATSADSLALYNNAIKVRDYYKNKGYVDIGTVPIDSATATQYLSQLDTEDKMYKQGEPSNINVYGSHGNRKYTNTNQLPFDFFRKEIDKNKFLRREVNMTQVDEDAPMIMYDKRIRPTIHSSYENSKNGDVADFLGYDPAQVKPHNKVKSSSSTPSVRHVIDPNDPRIGSYNKSLSLYNKDKNAYENETGLSYDDLLNDIGNSTDVVYTKSGKAIHLNRKPTQQFVYRDIKPSSVQGIEPYESNINVQANKYEPLDLSQKPTKYSATYREGNGQKTIYFKNKDAWKNFLGTNALSNVDTSETENSGSATGYRALQFGGELKPETGEVKDFYNQYLNSPNFRKRALEQGRSNVDELITDRMNNIKGVTTTVDNTLGSMYDAPDYTVVYNPKDAAEFGFPMQSVLAHEYGHTIGASQGKYLINPNLELNQNEMNAFTSRNKLARVNTTGMTDQQKLDVEHDSRPSESKADLDALRFRLFKDKIYDTGTQEFSPELLKKAKELYKNDNIVNRLFQNYSDEDLIYLMNHVAKNNITNPNSPIYG